MAMLASQWLKPGIHPTYSRLLGAYLQGLGFSQSDIFKGTHLHWGELVNEHRYLSLEQLSRLIRRAQGLTRQQAIGLEMARSTSVSAHGALGYAVVSAADLRAMLDVLVRFAAIRIRWISLSLSECQDGTTLHIDELLDLGPSREFIVGALLGTFTQMVNAIAPHQTSGMSVSLPFDSPAIRARYAELLDCHVYFGQAGFAIHLPEPCLSQPCLTADPSIHRNALRDCEHQLAMLSQGGPLSQQVSIALLDQAGEYPSLAIMAQRFAMSPRSLIRKLKAENTRYQQLLDKVRQEQALWLLQETALPIEQIAERLGYQDTSNFSRTFRRWFGATPLAMRNSPK